MKEIRNSKHVVVQRPSGRPIDLIDSLRPNQGVDKLTTFWEQAGGPLSIRDRMLLIQMSRGDLSHPRVAGASRFSDDPSEMLQWITNDSTRVIFFRGADKDELAELGKDHEVARSRYVVHVARTNREIENTVIIPMLLSAKPLLEILDGRRASSLAKWRSMHDFIQRWETGGNVMKIADAIKQMELARRRFGRNTTRNSLQHDRFIDAQAEAMRLSLVSIQEVATSLRQPGEIRELTRQIERWYGGYLQMTRLSYRIKLSAMMGRFERKFIQHILIGLGTPDLLETLIGERFMERFSHEHDQLRERCRDWFVRLEEMRNHEAVTDGISGMLSDLSHYVRGMVLKPKGYADLMKHRIAMMAPPSGESVDEDRFEAFKRIVNKWTEIRRNLKNGLGEGQPFQEIKDLFSGSRVVVDQRNDLPRGINQRVMLDILINLVLNSLKHLPDGDQYRVDVIGDRNKVVVRDNGLGIPLARQRELRLHEDDDLARPVESNTGTGQGFYRIRTRLLHELCEGSDFAASMSVVSDVGKGTVVTIAFNPLPAQTSVLLR